VIKPGDDWGTPTARDADVGVEGADADLATIAAAHPDALIRFVPDARSDLAHAIGLVGGETRGVELALDALRVGERHLAVNMVVLGTPPDRLRRFSRRIPVRVWVDGVAWFAGRATTVVIASGEFLRGLDVVPRGHPGDGRAEVQVYAAAPRERAALRARLRTGTHLPHPQIRQRSAHRIEVRWSTPRPLEIDANRSGRAAAQTVEVRPGACRLLV
jgi:YegS C-terminal NAD kinase beta sandwich-like domain